jgi:Ni2+-binding GTPase involved in maturation of urease and hydrogenase
MKLVICAGPPTSGKTTVLKQTAKRLIAKNYRLAYLKIDVQYAEEDELFKREFGIPQRRCIPANSAPTIVM